MELVETHTSLLMTAGSDHFTSQALQRIPILLRLDSTLTKVTVIESNHTKANQSDIVKMTS